MSARCSSADEPDVGLPHRIVTQRQLDALGGLERGRVRGALERLRTPLQVTFQQLVCLGVPFGTYHVLDSVGIDITSAVYLCLVVALTLTAGLIWAECLAARDPPAPRVSRPIRDRRPARSHVACSNERRSGRKRKWSRVLATWSVDRSASRIDSLRLAVASSSPSGSTMRESPA